jgi:hypothetical protein
MQETKAQRNYRLRNSETRGERMARLREEQRCLYDGGTIKRPRVVGKPGKRGRRGGGADASFRSTQGGAMQ